MKTKINKEQLQEIIKEETIKAKKILELKKRISEIKMELENSYGGGSAGEVVEEEGCEDCENTQIITGIFGGAENPSDSNHRDGAFFGGTVAGGVGENIEPDYGNIKYSGQVD